MAAGLGVALFGAIVERFVLRRLAGAELAQVLVTLGLSFMVADVCLMQWGGDPISVETPRRAARRDRGVRPGVPDLSARHHPDRRGDRCGVVAADGPHPARRDDPRRGR